MIAFLVIVLLVWTGMHIYVVWRALSVPFIQRHLPHLVFWGVAFVLWISYIAARMLEHTGWRVLGRTLEIIGANWVGVLFLLTVTLVAVDLLTVFGFLAPRVAPLMRGWALLAGALLAVVALVQGYRAPVIEAYEVRLRNLPVETDGTVIVLASDFHLGTQLGRTWLESRIRQIQGERPDVIVLAGDILEGDDASESDLLSSLQALHAPLGVWGVTGNHEFHQGPPSAAKAKGLDAYGVHMLHDAWTEIRPGLILAGVDDLTSQGRHGETGRLVEGAWQDGLWGPRRYSFRTRPGRWKQRPKRK